MCFVSELTNQFGGLQPAGGNMKLYLTQTRKIGLEIIDTEVIAEKQSV